MDQTKRQWLESRIGQLKLVRNAYESDWKEIFEQVMPHRPRWTAADYSMGTPRDRKLISGVAMRALRIFSAGMVASMSSPSRVWFRLTTSSPKLSDDYRIKRYLSQVERIIREKLIQSRFYQVLAGGLYPDLAAIATACAICEQPKISGLSFRSLSPGTYWLDVSADGAVDALFYNRPWTTRQVVEEFGREQCSPTVRNAWDHGNYADKVSVWRAIYPNRDWEPDRADRFGKRWSSDWWEEGYTYGWLRESGYEENPIIAPRWNTADGEVYGTGSPGWEAKSDSRQLQHVTKQRSTMADKIADPPMRQSDRHERASLIPGHITFVAAGGQGVFEPAHEVPPAALSAMDTEKDALALTVERAFYVDLWLSILRDARAQRATATEILEQRQEVMLQLGPLLDVLNKELLEPSILRSYQVLERQGLLPEPPEILQGENVNIEFISILHQAQKMTGLSSVRELVNNVLVLAQGGKAEALDKLDADAVIDEIADMLGVKPELVLSEEKTMTVRQARAEKQQAAEQGQAMLAATRGARDLSAADPEKLRDIAGSVAPIAAAGAGLAGA